MSKLKKEPIKDLAGYIVGYECKKKNIQMFECEKALADELIVPNHYSHKAVNNSCLNLIVLYNGKRCGAMQIGYGIRPKIKGEGIDPNSVREFDRMWLSDDMPKYSETICLSLLTHYLKESHPEIKMLISYADTSAGKTGTIYKAGNYKLVERLKADFYVLPNGERIHPVTMWHRHKTRKMDVLKTLYEGIKKAEGEQLKFIYKL